ncbi:MAG: methionyl-tRNA formyltransferase [Gammaproteobacteria bacterium]
MRIAIIGQQAFGKSVLEAFHARGDRIAGVFCAPEKPGARPDPLRQAAEALNIPVFQLASLKGPDAEQTLRELDVELAVMAYVLQFAPQAFVNIPRHGTIQYHPSLLPRHRGPSSINWPLIQGAKQTGLTIFRPTDGLDEGPIVLQKTVEIGPDDTLGSVYFDRLFPLGVAAMLEAADLVVSGRHQETPQDEALATYEGWCKDAEAQINWHAPVDTLYNLIRGCNPSPGAWTTIHGRKVRVLEARRHVVRRFGDVSGKPGEIVSIGDHNLVIAVQGGSVELLKVRVDGGEKLSAAAFANSAGLVAGDRINALAAAEKNPRHGIHAVA